MQLHNVIIFTFSFPKASSRTLQQGGRLLLKRRKASHSTCLHQASLFEGWVFRDHWNWMLCVAGMAVRQASLLKSRGWSQRNYSVLRGFLCSTSHLGLEWWMDCFRILKHWDQPKIILGLSNSTFQNKQQCENSLLFLKDMCYCILISETLLKVFVWHIFFALCFLQLGFIGILLIWNVLMKFNYRSPMLAYLTALWSLKSEANAEVSRN